MLALTGDETPKEMARTEDETQRDDVHDDRVIYPYKIIRCKYKIIRCKYKKNIGCTLKRNAYTDAMQSRKVH